MFASLPSFVEPGVGKDVGVSNVARVERSSSNARLDKTALSGTTVTGQVSGRNFESCDDTEMGEELHD